MHVWFWSFVSTSGTFRRALGVRIEILLFVRPDSRPCLGVVSGRSLRQTKPLKFHRLDVIYPGFWAFQVWFKLIRTKPEIRFGAFTKPETH